MSEKSVKVQQGLAALGVILSLIFVGLEVRQNTLAVRGSTIQAISDQTYDFMIQMAQDEDWMRIATFLGEGGKRAELSPVDQQRHNYVLGATVRIMENRYRQAQLGVIDWSEVSTSGGSTNTQWYRAEHFLDYWRSRDQTTIWTPEFVEFMETEVLAIR